MQMVDGVKYVKRKICYNEISLVRVYNFVPTFYLTGRELLRRIARYTKYTLRERYKP